MPEKRERKFLEKAKDAFETAKEKVDETTEKTRDVIKEHPLTSIIIAAAIGAIAGAITSELIKRSRRK